MIDSSWKKQEITNFKGSWSLVEKTDIQFDGALFAKNVRFLPGSVLSRFGVKSIFSPALALTSMWNWIFADPSIGAKNFLLFFSGAVKAIDLAGSTVSNLYAAAGRGAIFVNSGTRFISAHYTTSGIGADGGRIYGWGVGDDQLFARPVLTTEVGVGQVVAAGGTMTPGLRNVAFLMTTRNGFTGRPSPATADSVMSVVPTTVTTTTVNKKVTITLTPTGTWPTFSGTAEIIMTSTGNLARYYIVPDTQVAIPGGSGLPVSVVVDISDERLVEGTDATSFLSLLTQNYLGVAPFYPSSVIETGNRIGYVFKSSAYGQGVFFSEENNYQAISEARNIYFLPGQLEVIAGCYLDNSIYLIGPNWTFATTDNGNYPTTWTGAQQIDGTIGTVCPNGVAMNAARGMAWVVSKLGLYILRGGRYDTRPVSYYNDGDWKKINWDIFYDIKVTDNASLKTVQVLAPLKMSGYVNTSGTAVTYVGGDDFVMKWTSGTSIVINGVTYTISSITSPNALVLTGSAGVQTNVAYSVTPTYVTHAMTWDYTEGDTAETVKYSIKSWELFNVGTQAVVQNPTTQLLEMWYGNSAAGDIYREMNALDLSPYRDGSATVIDARYETALLPGSPGRDSYIHYNHGGNFRVLGGGGNLLLTCYTMDHASSKSMLAIPLTSGVGKEYWRATGSSSSTTAICKSYLLSNGRALDVWFQLSRILDYTSFYSKQT